MLDVEDVLGSSGVQTRLAGRVTIPPENAAAALEVMSRFAVDPRWLIYLPPTMAPTATTEVGTLLEHPAEAFASFRSEGIPAVICEEKHMGSRAIVIVCRSSEVAQRRFVATDAAGLAVTRTGTPVLLRPRAGAFCIGACVERRGRRRSVGGTRDRLVAAGR